MKKKIFLALLALVCVLCCAFGLAACNNNNSDDGGDITYRLQDNDTYAVKAIKSNSTLETAIIPAEYNGKPVTGIDDSAFLNSNITSVTIPDSVTSIGYEAFKNCGKLTSITLPDSVISIGGYAFSQTGLTSVTFGNSLATISAGAFSKCKDLRSLTIPDSITTINGFAFAESGLESIVLPSDWKTESGILKDCNNLTSLTMSYPKHTMTGELCALDNLFDGNVSTSLKTLTIKSGEVVGNFRTAPNLENLNLLDKDIEIKSSVLASCTSLKYNEYENGLYLGNETNQYLFLIKAKNTDIVSCKIHESTRTILRNAFEDCEKLENLSIGNNITALYSDMFEDCVNLESLSIGKGITAIYSDMFRNCVKLTTVEVYKFEFEKVNSSTSEKISLKDLFNLDKETSSVKTIKVADGVVILPELAFYYCSSLTEVILPASLLRIDYWAFRGCSNDMKIKFNGTASKWLSVEKNPNWGGDGRTVEYIDETA